MTLGNACRKHSAPVSLQMRETAPWETLALNTRQPQHCQSLAQTKAKYLAAKDWKGIQMMFACYERGYKVKVAGGTLTDRYQRLTDAIVCEHRRRGTG